MDEEKKEEIKEVKKEELILEERKEKFKSFVKVKYNWIIYVLLIGLVWFAAWLRSIPMKVTSSGHPGLWDITTNNWTLGPDLDPFLFLRYMKEIVLGQLPLIDTFRYSPLGFQTNQEFLLESYVMAYFHKIAVAMGFSHSVEQSAVIFPVVVFCLGVIAFFFFVRSAFMDELGKVKAGVLAAVSSFFMITIPALLPRTIAGIPDKQGSFVVFLFGGLYFLLLAWKAKSFKGQVIFALISGIITGILGLYWGGYYTIFVAVVPTIFVFYILGKMDAKKTTLFGSWILIAVIIMHLFSPRYTISNILTSFYTGSSLALLFVLAFNLFYTKYLAHKFNFGSKIPTPLKSLVLAGVIVFALGFVFLGPSYTFNMIVKILSLLISPAPTDRFNLTVAQNRVPYLSEIASNFGPNFGSVPVFFVIFLIGSIYLLARTVDKFEKKEKYLIVGTYIFMLFAILFSRYSASSTFNGDNFTSHAFYAIGLLAFGASLIYSYWKYQKHGKHDLLDSIRFEAVLVLVLFFFTLISVKGAVRLVLLLVPSAALVGSYLSVILFDRAMHSTRSQDETKKMFYWVFFVLVLLGTLFAAYEFYGSSVNLAQNYVPSSYTQQWQLAMGWVRTSTPANAVFAHWWDYGYWVQSIGNRTTVLDGGNYLTYWDYMMGRYALTESNDTRTLDFFYAHNVTDYLIDSTDIGKYPAFSTIGSDTNYDRASYIPTFMINNQQTQETNNATLYIYQGSAALDQDIMYTPANGSQMFLPSGKAGLAAIIIQKANNSSRIAGPAVGVYVYQNTQYNIPFRYIYADGKLYDFGTGLDAGAFVYSAVVQDSNTGNIGFQKDYTLLYLSPRTINSDVARFYLFNENSSYFKLAHSEDDLVVASLKKQGFMSQNEDFVYYGDLRGPIRIWQINYPSGMKVDPQYLETSYPTNLQQSR